jgi:glucose/arabinose dehydrogenase
MTPPSAPAWSALFLLLAPAQVFWQVVAPAQPPQWYDTLLLQLSLPAGFEISVYAEVQVGRSLAISANGTVFVGAYDFAGIEGAAGRSLAVHALRDLNGDGDALDQGENVAVTERMACPNGVAVLGADLYVAQMSQVLKYADVETNIDVLKTPSVVIGTESPEGAANGLPDTRWHGWRYLLANKASGKLYVAIGSPCNVPGDGEIEDCNDTSKHPLLGSIAEFDPHEPTPTLRPIAHGIRNTLGIDFHPTTGDMWFTDNGRDNWGGTWTDRGNGRYSLQGGAGTEDMPPGELNRLPGGAAGLAANLDFGFPRCYGRDHPDPSPDTNGVAFNPIMSCPAYHGGDLGATVGQLAASTAVPVGSVVDLAPHSATLGLRFYSPPVTSAPPPQGSQFPAKYWNRAFMAQHGSWDRTQPSGYAVASVAITSEDGRDESARASSSTGPYVTHEFLSGFRPDPPVRCLRSSDCPGNSTCQTRAPQHGQVARYCGGRGRPADLLVLPDGSLLVSDEMNSLVYRITYTNSEACDAALQELCAPARRASAGNCFVCVGQHQEQLKAAHCRPTNFDSFCHEHSLVDPAGHEWLAWPYGVALTGIVSVCVFCCARSSRKRQAPTEGVAAGECVVAEGVTIAAPYGEQKPLLAKAVETARD